MSRDITRGKFKEKVPVKNKATGESLLYRRKGRGIGSVIYFEISAQTLLYESPLNEIITV